MPSLKDNQGLVLSGYGKQSLIKTKFGQYTLNRRSSVNQPVAGDIVEYQNLDREKIITGLLPRKNFLSRDKKPIAANIDYLLLFVSVSPLYQLDLIDRYLVLARTLKIPIKILFNKIDLLADHPKDLALIKNTFNTYQTLGYEVYYLSLLTSQGMDAVLSFLKQKTYLVVGQSGVGKSSLLNKLIPKLALKIQGLSNMQLGKHTTSNIILYQTKYGNVIDSPGVREFNLSTLNKKDVAKGFIEISQYAHQCKFCDCVHINEPNCAVKKALKDKLINTIRYKSYCRLMQELGNK